MHNREVQGYNLEMGGTQAKRGKTAVGLGAKEINSW